MTARLTTPTWQTQLTLNGQFAAKQWAGQVKNWQFNFAKQAPLMLDKPSQLWIGPQLIKFTPLCFNHQQICFSGHWQQANAWQFKLLANHFRSQVVTPLFQLQSQLQGQLTLTQTPAKLWGEGQLTLSPGKLA